MHPGKLIIAKKVNGVVETEYYYSFEPLTDISLLLRTTNLFSMDLSKTLTVFHGLYLPDQRKDQITIRWEDRVETFAGSIIFASRDLLKNVLSLDAIAEEEIRIKLKEIK
ncbi:hypothetical protein [Enterococcus plantarum]|uniref:hypothetical protein n=1 Tax=Enterococcus plantarum TaxID=1077675 RepID=UPI001A8D5C84|nr:hypothetical protein [Enterococcus plantarum]MBO0423404.1 hypothetical protein [Enterococcus plantarum]